MVEGREMTAEQVLQLHSEGFNRALTQQDYDALEGIYSEMYMLVRPDGSVLNKQQILKDLREQGLRIYSIELEEAAVRVVGSVGILTAASKTVQSRNGKESQAHFRLVAVYSQEGDAIRLVHFQSTMIVEKQSA
ncbi:MAG TPA: nuclear transport factor 2 family protein [Bryobacteraceae bacterium]|nr:nuclear transport factor 2 family protein [Bryobacteraceae bacterium]